MKPAPHVAKKKCWSQPRDTWKRREGTEALKGKVANERTQSEKGANDIFSCKMNILRSKLITVIPNNMGKTSPVPPQWRCARRCALISPSPMCTGTSTRAAPALGANLSRQVSRFQTVPGVHILCCCFLPLASKGPISLFFGSDSCRTAALLPDRGLNLLRRSCSVSDDRAFA